ncbi:hypothetical protein JAAARDRAFT_122400, partial [Jaapia argillacea MUCL 33604]
SRISVATAPWIALVSCDYNATNASISNDIFTLARDRGARAVLMYSLYSQECLVSFDYATSSLNQTIDIFSGSLKTSLCVLTYSSPSRRTAIHSSAV